jgi:two-component system chemotaxis sensor kinase CheA
VFEYILRPGFTTREVVTDVSGRGVGMDVVLTNVKKFGGDITLHSEPGRGTRIQIVLPCSLLLSAVLLIQTQERLYSLPTGSIERIIPLKEGEIAVYKNKRTVLYDGNYIPILSLTGALRLPEEGTPNRYGVVLQKGDKKLCLAVPEIVDEEELMMKPLPPHFRNIPLFSGANILTDGRISLVINPARLHAAAQAGGEPVARRKRPRRKRLLVVDDSFVARELLKNILLTYGYDVATAGDGMDGLAHARSHPIDLILSDIEMPRMDGIALTHAVKSDAALRAIPVIILSAREDEEHRRRGIEAGANAYIVKGTFTQHNLISSIEHLVPETA